MIVAECCDKVALDHPFWMYPSLSSLLWVLSAIQETVQHTSTITTSPSVDHREASGMCLQMRSHGNRHDTLKYQGCSLSSYAMLCACVPQSCMSYRVRALKRVICVTFILLASHNMTLQCRQGQPADSAGHGDTEL